MAMQQKLFGGSYMDGPDVDLVAWSGARITDGQVEALWSDNTPERLIEKCSSAFMDTEEFDGPSGQSDTFYTVHAADPERFRKELAAVILKAVRRKA